MKKSYKGMGMSVDAPLAPAVGGGTAALTMALAKAFAKPGGWAHRNAGWLGVITGTLTSTLYGVARGTGAGVAGGVTALGVGGTQQLVQALNNWRVNRLTQQTTTTPAPAPESAVDEAAAGSGDELPVEAGGDVPIKGLGMVRARVYGGLGGARGYLPANGSSPVDVMSTGIAVPAF